MLPSTQCFYTGLQLNPPKTPGVKLGEPYTFSKEHLLSKKMLQRRKVRLNKPGRRNINIVPSSSLVNGLIGVAPIRVKFALKEHFRGIKFVFMDEIRIKGEIKYTVQNFLNQYLIHGVYPWHWMHGKLTKAERKDAYTALLDLLTDEEKKFRLHHIR